MQSSLILFVVFALIGCAFSATVENVAKSIDSSVNASPERRNDLLVAEEPQPEADNSAEADLEGSATHYRAYRRAYYGGYGGYGGYSGYPSYGYSGYSGYGGYPYNYGGYGGHHRGYYGSSYPGYYGGYGSYGHGYSGYGHHGYRRGYYY